VNSIHGIVKVEGGIYLVPDSDYLANIAAYCGLHGLEMRGPKGILKDISSNGSFFWPIN